MSDPRRSRVVSGIVLICVGLFFLVDQLDLFDFGWWMIPIAMGVGLLIQSMLDKHHQPLQSGVFLLLLGLFFMADEYNWLLWGFSRDWPLMILALAVSFVVDYWANPSRRSRLTSGITLLVVGSLFLAAEYHYFDWDIVGDIVEWWPLLLLGAGVWLLLKERKPKPPSTPPVG